MREAIRSGFYANGDQLPVERELAERFDSTRSTIRKVLLRLETERLVERRVGSGTFVTRDDLSDGALHDIIVGRIGLLELIETRLAIEPHMTRLAVFNGKRRAVTLVVI